MVYYIRHKLLAVALPIVLLLSACQPIQPEQASTDSACTDAAKIALLQTYVDSYRDKDPEAAVALFLPDAQLTGTGGPVLDMATGEYSMYDVEFNGEAEILGIVQWFVEGAHLTNTIHDPVVQGNTVTAPGVVGTPFFFAHAIPATELDLIFTMEVVDCKIAHLDWKYTEETMAALPAAAEAMASTCADDYKLGVLQSYVSGINEGDKALAAWPYAKNTHFEFEMIPQLDPATETYTSDPPLVLNNLEEFKAVIDYFIEISLSKTLDESSIAISGPTLAVSSTLSTPLLTGEPWFLPVTEVNGKYTVTFDENCKIVDLMYSQEAGIAETLTALRKQP